MKLLIATRNRDKLKEIKAVFDLPQLELVSADEVPDMPEVVEDGDTLEANAIKKAVSCAEFSGLWSMADDTGLEVDALDGAPGVYSARYAGEDATYEDNCHKLLIELGDADNRSARFRTVMALSSPEGEAQTVDGICDGVITREKKGDQGFGYDPVFLPAGHDRTFAELDLAEKNRISHRGLALIEAKQAWLEMLQGLGV
ncbi:MAG: XTP/dITP diphosphatase [Verrucomicrobiota bacterium]